MSKPEDYRVIFEFMNMVAQSCNPYEGGQVVLEKTLPELIENRGLSLGPLPHWVVESLPEHFVCGICGRVRFGTDAVHDTESGKCCSSHFGDGD